MIWCDSPAPRAFTNVADSPLQSQVNPAPEGPGHAVEPGYHEPRGDGELTSGLTTQRAGARHTVHREGRTVTSTPLRVLAHLKTEYGPDGKPFTDELLAMITELSPTGA